MKPPARFMLRSWLSGLTLALAVAAPAVHAATTKDTLVIAKSIDDIISLDPAEVYEHSPGEIVNNLYDRIFTFDTADFTKVAPGVAEKWESSADGKTFTLHIRKGLTFQSGHKLTAADVAYSLQRVVILGKAPSFILTQFGWSADNVQTQVTAPDDSTVALKLSAAFAPTFVLNALSSSVASVVDKEEAQAHQKDNDYGYNWLKSASAGSGPYKLVSWQAKNTVILEAGHNYWRGEPKLSHVVIRHVPEATAQRLLLDKGDIDVARNLTPDQVAAEAGNDKLTVLTTPGIEIAYLGLSQKVPALANPKVREALRWLVDYQGLTNSVLKGQYNVHQAIVAKGTASALNDTPFHLDVAKAKALLAEAGYPDGFSFDLDLFNTTPWTDIGQSLQSTFAQANVRVKLQPADQKQVWTKFRGRGSQAALVYWVPDYLDPHSTTDFFTSNPDNSDSGKKNNAAWRLAWDIPDLTAQTAQALVEKDQVKRDADYIDLQRNLQQDSPILVLFQKTDQTVERANVKDFIVGPSWDTATYWKATK